MREFVFAGGGTAGHVMPAIAIAESLEEQGISRELLRFRGVNNGVEALIIPKYGYEFRGLPGKGFRRSLSFSSIRKNVFAISALVYSTLKTMADFLRCRPGCVVVVGGHGSAPSALSALVLRVPVVVIQLDAHFGAVNKFVSRFAKVVTLPSDQIHAKRGVVTGIPVRNIIRNVTRSSEAARSARDKFALPDKPVVLVMGGSLGSRTLNEAAPELAELLTEFSIVHIAGLRNQTESTDTSANYFVLSFVEDMQSLYEATDVAVSRVGANSVAELSAAQIPSIFVPLPIAPADHQRKNAQPVVNSGGAQLLNDDRCTAVELASRIRSLYADIDEHRETLRQFGSSNAADKIASIVCEVVK